jgi:hypothetical protein
MIIENSPGKDVHMGDILGIVVIIIAAIWLLSGDDGGSHISGMFKSD